MNFLWHRLSGEVNFRVRNFTSRDSSLWTSFPNEGVSASFSFHPATRAISALPQGRLRPWVDRLYVVSPRHPEYRTDPDAIAFSTHAVDVLQNSVCTETLLEALKDVSFACALSGYDREFGPPLADLQTSCEMVKTYLEENPQKKCSLSSERKEAA